jgi:hypothetical protein
VNYIVPDISNLVGEPKQEVGRATGYGNVGVTVAADNPAHYKFEGWADETGTIVSQSATFKPEPYPTADVTYYYAKFTENTYDINYQAGKGGTVSRSKDTPGLATNSGIVGSTATPNKNYRFVNWTDSNNKVVNTKATYVPGQGAETYTANFAEITYTVKYKAGSGGKVSNSSDTVGAETQSGIKGAKATAKKGFKFVRWEDAAGNTVSKKANFKPSNVKGDAAYTAVFAQIPDVVVKVGDPTTLGAWITLSLVAAAGVAFTVLRRRGTKLS